MSRGKRQILLGYLPGRAFDFAQVGTIAKVTRVRGTPNTQLNPELVLRSVQQYANAWKDEHRAALRDPTPDSSRFVLLDPKAVEAEMFPLVFHCQNRACGLIVVRTSSNVSSSRTCPKCRKDRLEQLRFVKIHRCGEIQPLTPYCSNCRSNNNMSLDTRGSERISGFKWKCLTCNRRTSIYAAQCRACNWTDPIQNVQDPRNMDIEVFRSARTYYVHHVVLLNQPGREMDAFLQIAEWPMLAAAAFLELPELKDRKLLEFATMAQSPTPDVALTNVEMDDLLQRLARGAISAQDMAAEMQVLRTQRSQKQQKSAPAAIAQALIQRTGINATVWQSAGRELLESVLLMQTGTIQNLFERTTLDTPGTQELAKSLASKSGISQLTSVNDFPITTATFGFSRSTYQPDQCRLNLFPADADHGGKFPIFVDLVQADALVIRLNPDRIWKWLIANNLQPSNIGISTVDPELGRLSYFVSLFEQAEPAIALPATQPQARMVFGLLHTLSHVSIRHAALLCGLDRTSLSEYVLPRTLSFALYCNHRFGATIGALTSLFEQSLDEWLTQIRDNRRCVYDPVCEIGGGTCHACVHLAETSCRFFNVNLSRSFLFGGNDVELGNIKVGFFDDSLSE
jgi:hypothetical protein